jgi:uncharacterized OB-fold protein
MTAPAIEERFAAFEALAPEPTELNAPYWEGLAAGELRLQRCTACGAHQHPAESFCYECGATELEWVTVSGEGTIYSFIVVHQPYHPAFQPFLPYTVATVELDEGPRLLGAMLELDAPVAIGDRVAPRIEPIAEGRAALFFRPLADAS